MQNQRSSFRHMMKPKLCIPIKVNKVLMLHYALHKGKITDKFQSQNYQTIL